MIEKSGEQISKQQLGIFRQERTLHVINIYQWKQVNYIVKYFKTMSVSSRVEQWKRAGPITQGSEDQDVTLLAFIFVIFFFTVITFKCYLKVSL